METRTSSSDTLTHPVIVELAGGLGNQLFQYAFGQYIHTVTHRPVLYDCTAVKRDAKRKLLITAFDIESCLFIHSRRSLFSILGARIHTSLSVIEQLIHRLIPYKDPHTLEHILCIDDDVLSARAIHTPQDIEGYMEHLCTLIQDNGHRPVYCRGYWQYAYVTIQNRKMDIPHLHYKGILRDSVRTLLEKLATHSHVSCALHIRRGDYLVPSIDNILPRITREYYQHAVDSILRTNPDTHFYVFSDDAQWCKDSLLSMLGRDVSFTVVSDTISHTPVEDMILMNHCYHKILVNSSFGWWGAQLTEVLAAHPHVSFLQKEDATYTEAVQSVIIAPALWFTQKIKNELIVPSSWQRL